MITSNWSIHTARVVILKDLGTVNGEEFVPYEFLDNASKLKYPFLSEYETLNGTDVATIVRDDLPYKQSDGSVAYTSYTNKTGPVRFSSGITLVDYKETRDYPKISNDHGGLATYYNIKSYTFDTPGQYKYIAALDYGGNVLSITPLIMDDTGRCLSVTINVDETLTVFHAVSFVTNRLKKIKVNFNVNGEDNSLTFIDEQTYTDEVGFNPIQGYFKPNLLLYSAIRDVRIPLESLQSESLKRKYVISEENGMVKISLLPQSRLEPENDLRYLLEIDFQENKNGKIVFEKPVELLLNNEYFFPYKLLDYSSVNIMPNNEYKNRLSDLIDASDFRNEISDYLLNTNPNNKFVFIDNTNNNT